MSPGRESRGRDGPRDPLPLLHREAHDLAAQVVGYVTGPVGIRDLNQSELAGTVCPERERWRFHLNQKNSPPALRSAQGKLSRDLQ